MKRLFILLLLIITSSVIYSQNFWSALTNNDFKSIQSFIDEQGFDIKQQPVMGFYFANYTRFDKNLMTYLLAKGADLNREYKGSSPLVYLLSRENENQEWCVELLLTNGVQINPRSLQKAYTSCNIDVVKLLLSQKIVLSEVDVRDLMKIAYKRDNLAMGGMLIDMSTHQTILNEAFLWAVQDGRLEWVQLLFTKGADMDQEVPITIPSLAGQKKSLGIVELARNFGHDDVVKFLIDYGAELTPGQSLEVLKKAYQDDDIDAAQTILNRNSMTAVKNQALLWAVKDKRINWITTLVFKGAEVNTIVRGGHSVFYHAIATADSDLISVLQSFGAKPGLGEASQLIEKVYEMDDLKLLDTLIANGITIEEMNNILIRSVKENRKKWMITLISKGADIHTKDKDGVTIFIHALNAGSVDIVKELLERDELHEASFPLFKKQYPRYELFWGAIINDLKWIKKYSRNKKLAVLKGPNGKTAMELYLAFYGGTVLHWYAITEDIRSLKSALPRLKDKIYEVNDKGMKAIDMAESEKIKRLFEDYMY